MTANYDESTQKPTKLIFIFVGNKYFSRYYEITRNQRINAKLLVHTRIHKKRGTSSFDALSFSSSSYINSFL